ncbi:MAG: hypothetical protein ACHQ4J_08130 [Candidatus Binatia bacterium]
MNPAELLDRRFRKRRHFPRNFQPVRKQTPADWGIGMTVCIAAIAGPNANPRIVAVSDFMLSNDTVSFDTQTLKCQPVSDSCKWFAFYAGDPSAWNAVFDAAVAAVRGSDESAATVQAAFEAAFRKELKHKIEGELLSSFGLDRDTFIQHGREYFGQERFNTLLDEVRAAALEMDVLVAGFDREGWPHIFSVSDPSIVENHNNIRFHVVGTGAVLAESALCASYDPSLNVHALAYRLCEAKFLAEPASGVGAKTFVIVIAPDGTHQVMYPEHVEELRGIWKREGRPSIPTSAIAKIQERLVPIKEWRGHK